MIGSSPLHAFWSLLCTLIALFYLFRLVGGRVWLPHFDAEDEVGHGMMAIGMIVMLAPASLLTSDILHWNLILFAVASLWWTCRLLARKPLLAIVLKKNGGPFSFQSDIIHLFTHVGMCYMFLLISSMAFSMAQPAIYADYIFVVSFVFLTLFYSREVSKDLQAATLDKLKLSAHIAHILMSTIMGWMFIEMISMTMRMISP